MLHALRILRYSVSDAWDELAVLVALNLVWTLTALAPAFPGLFVENPLTLVDVSLIDISLINVSRIAISLLLGLPLPVVSGALCHVANQVTRGQVATWHLFVEGVRRYWVKSLAVAALNLLALVILLANVRFYTVVVQAAWAPLALSAWLVAGIYWALVQIYWFPMILEIQSERVLEALRHAAALVIISPGFSLSVGVLALLVVVLCVLTTLPAILLMASLLLLLINHATRSRLALVQKKPYRPHDIEQS